ncbi:MAG: DedA family protein [Lysinibacillus sp.]
MALFEELITNYGYIAIFIILALGLFSLPIPDELMILLVGYFTKIGLLHYSSAFIVVFFGSLLGMIFSYVLGKRAGRPLFDWLGRWMSTTKKWSAKAEGWIEKYGAPAIIVSYFVPGMRHIAGGFCGMSHMSFKTYTVYASISAGIWSFLFLTIGRIF